MKQSVWYATLVLLLWPVAGTAQDPATLHIGMVESIQRAINHSHLVRSAELATEGAHLKVRQAQYAYVMPRLEIENYWGVLPRRRGVKADGTPGRPGERDFITSPDTSTGFGDLRPFTQTEIKIIQPLWTGGRLSNAKKAAEYGVEAVEAKKVEAEGDLALKIAQLYWGTILLKNLYDLSDDARAKMKDASETLQQKIDDDDDDITMEDLWKTNIFRFSVQTRHEELLKQIKLTRSAYAMALGLEETGAWDVDNESLKSVDSAVPSYETCLAQALERRPELHQLMAGLKATRAKVNIENAGFYPSIFIAGGLQQNWAMDRFDPDNPFLRNNTNFFRPGAVLGFKLDLNFHETRRKKQEAEVKRLIVAEQLQAAQQGIALQAREAYLNVEEAAANIRYGEAARRDGVRWQRSAARIWDAGLGEVKDLIDAYKANGEMQAEYLTAIFEYNVAIAKLQHVTGERYW